MLNQVEIRRNESDLDDLDISLDHLEWDEFNQTEGSERRASLRRAQTRDVDVNENMDTADNWSCLENMVMKYLYESTKTSESCVKNRWYVMSYFRASMNGYATWHNCSGFEIFVYLLVVRRSNISKSNISLLRLLQKYSSVYETCWAHKPSRNS